MIMVFVVFAMAATADQAYAAKKDMGKFAAIGAVGGLLIGRDLRGALDGAALGAGAAALGVGGGPTSKTARTGAYIGAGIGVLTDGFGGAVRGGAYGATIGGLLDR